MSTRKKRAYLGFVTDLGGTVSLILIRFIAIPLYLTMVSGELYGYWLTLLSLLGWLALTDLGLGVSLMRLVAGERNKEKLSQLLSTSFFTFLLLGGVFFVTGALLNPFIPKWFNIPKEVVVSIVPTYMLLLLSGALALPLSIFGSMLEGFQRMAFVNTVRTFTLIIGIGVTLGLMYFDVGVVSLAYGQLFTIFSQGIVNFYFLKRTFPDIKLKFNITNKHDLVSLLSFGGYFQLSRIANTVSTSTDNLVIASVLGASSVNTYVFTAKMAELFSQNLASKLPVAVMPGMAELFSQKDYHKIREVFQKLSCYTARLAILASSYIFIANKKFVELWVGNEYFGGFFLGLTFAYWALQDSFYRGITGILYSSGEMKKWTIATTIEAALNLALTLLLIKPLGLVGVALGTSIAKTSTTTWYTPYVICRKVGLPLKDYMARLVSTGVKCIPSIAAMYLTSIIIPVQLGWFWLVLVGGTGASANILTFERNCVLSISQTIIKKYVSQK